MKIRFQSLQDSLRSAIWARLERGELTGKTLAYKAGFQQAHLSNFLNSKRGLSLQAMDRLLDVLHLDVLQLAGVDEAMRNAFHSQRRNDDTEAVAVVTLADAARLARFSADHIQDTVRFRRSFLRSLKSRTVGNRRDWTRFVVATVDEENASRMAPLLKLDARVLIDRHYNAPPPLSDPSPADLYAVRSGPRHLITRLTVAPGHLIVRPLQESASSPVELIAIPSGRRAADFIIGRVRHVAMAL
jgi:transcriptional regulator with XRE-family HTH domain